MTRPSVPFILSVILLTGCRPDDLRSALDETRAKLAETQRALDDATERAREATDATGLPDVPANFLQPQDLFELELARDPQISPDGKRIVYVRQFADIMSDRRMANLWIIDADGRNHRALTTGHQVDASPRWSPDGSRLAFTSTRDGSAQIYVRWVDGGQEARLTNLQFGPGGIEWSPDGTQIAFVAHVPSTPAKTPKMPAAPKGAEWAKPAKVIDKLTYRFDKRGYLEPGHAQLFVIGADGGTPRQLSSGDYPHRGRPSWTRDGKHILLSALRQADYDMHPVESEIYQFDVGDGSVATLTKRKGPDGSPTVSPDGSKIAYVGYDDKGQSYQVSRLYVMNRDGTDPKALTLDLDRSVGSPAWSADGKGVYFTYAEEGNTKLAHVSLAGKRREVASSLGSTDSAYSGGASFTVGRGDRIAFTRARPQVPGDIAVTGRAGAKPAVVTHLNADLLAKKVLGEVEEIWFESSKDGRKIQAWLIKPPGFDETKKYPLILEIHGGPFANYGDRFDVEKQMWAAHGYVVLYVNPRGSTSYGQEFGNLIHHRYPGDDFFDLDSGVDAAIAKGYVDADNLFVTGGSGGGVLTCWMIGRSDRFRAAASAYPVINWYSFALTTDISALMTKYWFPGNPWDHEKHYMERSLFSVIKNVKTPTMVITGEQDWRTPISESEQYYKALKLLGVEAVMVRFPGEPHGIRARPSHHMGKILHIVSWFETHRGDGSAKTEDEVDRNPSE